MDPTPATVQAALSAATDAPGYPLTAGSLAFRTSAAQWLGRRGAPVDPGAVLPSIGSKEVVAWLPTLLDLGPGDTVVIPTLAYPTYDVGARLAGCAVRATDDPGEVAGARLVWINTPANPHGAVLTIDALRVWVDAARAAGAILVSDECYLELGWDGEPVSVLDTRVTGGDHSGVLAVHSLSKRSNLAGYRVGVVAGDPGLIARLLEVRKHAGMMLPAPMQAAACAAFSDDEHVGVQREVYRGRRAALRAACDAAGLRIDHSEAGLYLWATRDEPCWQTVEWFAERGVLVTPGEFYGAAGAHHVRIALTATDERVAAAVARLTLRADEVPRVSRSAGEQ